MRFLVHKAPLFLSAAIMALPCAAFAGSSDRITFSSKPKTVVKLIKSEKGMRQYLIASNAKFKILSEGLIGDVRVKLKRSGHVKTFAYGASAQLPGKALTCRTQRSFFPRIIYTAKRKTAAHKGKLSKQAVLVTIRFPKMSDPKFSFISRSSVGATAAPVRKCRELMPKADG